MKDCHIISMLKKQAKKKHVSFHTPGHKRKGADITELSYSDNLAAPKGCILRAEKDIAAILGAKKSFILTDGSTCGVLSMLYAIKTAGARTVAFSLSAHKSVYNGCKLLGLTPLLLSDKVTAESIENEQYELISSADALFLTSPNYYGYIPDLEKIRAFCDREKKILLIDGAHGAHLHFDKKLYAGAYADMWVDGVHKSLPAFTQGAVVSARTETFAKALREGADVFRTTSPSYPIMASVEYAVKYPQNKGLEKEVRAYAEKTERVCLHEDWTKLCVLFGENAFLVEKELEQKGIYAEFCDGNTIMFYLSPALPLSAFRRLTKEIDKLLQKYPYTPKTIVAEERVENVSRENKQKKWEELDGAVGKICGASCGLFPPCIPLIQEGEKVSEEKVALLKQSANVFGLVDGKILIIEE